MTAPQSASPTIGDDPQSVFGVGGEPPTAPVTRLQQRLGGAVVDHRGRVDVAAWAVLVDAAVGSVVIAQTPPDRGVVQSRLTFATTGVAPTPEGLLTAVATLRHDGGASGLTTVDVTVGDDLVGTAVARSVRTGRTFDAALADKFSGAVDGAAPQGLPVPDALAHDAVVPPAIDPVLTGAQIMAAMVEGRIAPGPIAEVLGLTPVEGGAVLRPAPWTANALGSMHGGVVSAVMAQACAWAGQSLTGAGQDHRLTDLTVDFFRSPPVEGEPMRVTTEVVRAGRRVGTISAELRGPDDTLLVQASGSVHFS